MQASSAYVKLAELAQQHHVQRREGVLLPESPLWVGIQFVLQGRHLMCAVSDVVEVLTLPKMTKLPGVLPWMQGLANVRGRLLPVIDLGLYLFNESHQQKNHLKRVLVVERKAVYCGLLVDEVFGRQHCAYEEVTPVDCVDPVLKPYITGEFAAEDGDIWQVMSLTCLIEHPQFLRAAI